jgi:predicted amidophosphoribosyltransferase
MAGTAAAAVRCLKYGRWRELAEEMGDRMARVRFSSVTEAEIAAVLPVPLSGARLRERGFNQSELLAGWVARARGRPLLRGVLGRPRHTRSQARLSPGARAANVAGAFRVAEDGRDAIEDLHLLLVDDVLTTAATAEGCVRALCSAGARGVSVLTFARARRELAATRG